jgi:hypothetical protein
MDSRDEDTIVIRDLPGSQILPAFWIDITLTALPSVIEILPKNLKTERQGWSAGFMRSIQQRHPLSAEM